MGLPSLWEGRHPVAPTVSAGLDGHHDGVVVGAGITGLCVAVEAARAGREVLVLEARSIGAGTTGRSTAKVSLLQGDRLSQIASHQSVERARTYIEANRAAQTWVEEFCGEHGVALQRRPAYTVAWTERGLSDVRREHDLARQVGLATHWCDEVAPFPVAGAVRLDDQLQVDPLALVHALAAEVVRLGGTVAEGARVEHVGLRSPVEVRTAAGTVIGDHVVIATGTPVLDRGAHFARLEPARSYSLAFRTPTQAVDGMYLSVDQPSRSVRDDPGDAAGPVLLVGGNGHPTGRGGSTLRRLDQLREWTHEHFPDAEETHAWSAQDYVPHHQLPLAGPVLPGQDGVLMATGFAKWGMTNGPAAALALVGRIQGRPVAWSDAFDTWTRRELRGWATLARLNAAVGFEMGRGWVRPVTGRGAPQGVPGERQLSPVVGLPKVRPPDTKTPRLSGVCTHLGGVVAWNDAERSWDCPLHGSRFDDQGGVLDGPASCGLRRR